MKGAGIREIVKWHERQVGRARVRTIGDALPAEIAGQLDLEAEALGILPTVWYPARLGHVVLDGIFGRLAEVERAAAMRDAAHAAVRATGRGVYRFVLERIATPAMLAGNIQRLWNMLYDDGERSLVLLDAASMESTTREWSGHGASTTLLCELMCQNTAAVLETMGRRDVQVDRASCVGRGARECVIRYRWTP
jgi:hypothetical protein